MMQNSRDEDPKRSTKQKVLNTGPLAKHLSVWTKMEPLKDHLDLPSSGTNPSLTGRLPFPARSPAPALGQQLAARASAFEQKERL